MSLSYNITGYIPADETWNKMKEVREACINADISVPEEVAEFFDYQNPDNLPGLLIDITDAITESNNDNGTYWELDLKKLPRKDIQFLRFTISC